MAMEEESKRYTAKEASEVLKIPPSTLRTYTEALEKEGYFIERNNQNHRQFTSDDISFLRTAIQRKADMELTIKNAVKQVMNGANGEELLSKNHHLEIVQVDNAEDYSRESGFSATPLQARLLMEIQEQMENQQTILKKVSEDIAATKAQNMKLMEEHGLKPRDLEEEERIRREAEEMNRNIRYIREQMEVRQEVAVTTSVKKWQFWKR